jgi:hypothetical protein
VPRQVEGFISASKRVYDSADMPGVSYADFRWAVDTVATRSMRSEKLGEKRDARGRGATQRKLLFCTQRNSLAEQLSAAHNGWLCGCRGCTPSTPYVCLPRAKGFHDVSAAGLGAARRPSQRLMRVGHRALDGVPVLTNNLVIG